MIFVNCNYRSRFERRIYKTSDDQWRFREKLEIKPKQKWTALKFQPYIADEIFYQKNKDGFYRNWFILGFDLNFIKPLKSGLFYQLQSEHGKNDTNIYTDIVALKLNFDF